MDVTPRWTAICWLHGRDDKVTTIPPTDGSSNTQPGPFIKHFINHFRIRIFCTGCNYKPILLVLNLFNSLKCLLVGQLVGSCIMCWLIILFHGSYDIFLPDANLAPNTLVVEIIRPVPCCRCCCCSWSISRTVNVSREITASVSTNLAECMNRFVKHHWTYLSGSRF